MRKLRMALLAAFGLGLASTGCDNYQKGDGLVPTSLREVTIPAEFTFKTSQSLMLQVGLRPGLLANDQGTLTVQREDGGVLYRGPLRAGGAQRVGLALPTKEHKVVLTLSDGLHERQAEATVSGAQLEYRFE